MIAKEYYIKGNVKKLFFTGKLAHYLHRPAVVVTKWYLHTLTHGDTLYSLTEMIFGKGNDHFWYILADLNSLREVDSWEEGDVIKLPEEIVVESTPTEARNSRASSKAKIVTA